MGRGLVLGGDYRSAETPFTRALALREKVLGPEHPDVATSLNNLAELYYAQGRYAEAEPLFTRALAIGEKALGLDHPNFETLLQNYVRQLQQTNRQAEAEPLLARLHASRPPRGWLGLELARQEEPLGILVVRVITDSPAAHADFHPGDVIVRFQGHPMQDVAEFIRRITAQAPGISVNCDIVRHGQPRTIQVTLGARPVLPQ